MMPIRSKLIVISMIAMIIMACVCPVTSLLQRNLTHTELPPEITITTVPGEQPEFSIPTVSVSEYGESSQSAEGMLELVDSQIFTSNSAAKAVFCVQNNTSDQVIVDSKAQVDVFSDENKVLDTQTQYLPVLMPKQKMYYVSYLNINQDIKVGKVTVTLHPGQAKQTDMHELPISVTDLSYFQNEYSNMGSAVITNTANYLIRDVNLTLVGFDQSGKIIALGTGYQSVLPPGKAIPVQLYTEGELKPARLELYSSVNYLDSSDPEKWNEPAIEVLRTQLISKDNRNLVITEIKSTDKNTWTNASFLIAGYDANGVVLATLTWPVTYLTAGQTIAIASDLFTPTGYKIDHISVIPLEMYPATSPISPDVLVVEQADYLEDQYNPRVTGILRNNLEKRLISAPIAAIIEDSSGKIIGGGTGYVDSIEAGGTSAYVVNVFVDGKPAKVKVYPMLPYLE